MRFSGSAWSGQNHVVPLISTDSAMVNGLASVSLMMNQVPIAVGDASVSQKSVPAPLIWTRLSRIYSRPATDSRRGWGCC